MAPAPAPVADDARQRAAQTEAKAKALIEQIKALDETTPHQPTPEPAYLEGNRVDVERLAKTYPGALMDNTPAAPTAPQATVPSSGAPPSPVSGSSERMAASSTDEPAQPAAREPQVSPEAEAKYKQELCAQYRDALAAMQGGEASELAEIGVTQESIEQLRANIATLCD